MINEKFILKKTHKVNVLNMINDESESCYSRLKALNIGDYEYLFIAIISSVTVCTYDFYIDINRGNNIFYNNVNNFDLKLLKKIYKLISTYAIIRFLENNKEIDATEELLKYNYQIFKYNGKDKKLFTEYRNIYIDDIVSFDLKFTACFAKKTFTSRKKNAMEFAYINHFLENFYYDFNKNYFNNYEAM